MPQHIQQMRPLENRGPPGNGTIGRHALKWREELFGNDNNYYYDMKSIIKLSNRISGYNNAPNPNKLLWRYCIASLQSVYNVMHTLGIRVLIKNSKQNNPLLQLY